MPEKEGNSPTSSAFISYSRRNKEFVVKLNDALDSRGVNAWVDWEGIPLSSDWMAEITHAIEGADAFIFVISPDSLASEVCAKELELGIQYNKKLVPVLYLEPEKGTKMHEKLAATNWVYMRPQDDFEATMPKLVEAIQTDLEWVRQHTRLLQRAKEWDSKKRNSSFLLQGEDLDEAEQWRSAAATSNARQVVQLQNEYIDASREAALRRQRMFRTGAIIVTAISLSLAILAGFFGLQANQNFHVAATAKVEAEINAQKAEKNYQLAATAQVNAEISAQKAIESEKVAIANEKDAKAQRSAANAQYLQQQPGRLYDSIILALDALIHQTDPKKADQPEEILRKNISLLPPPISDMNQNGAINSIIFARDGQSFVTTSADKENGACVWKMDGSKLFCVSHNAAVNDAIFTQDDKILITAGNDGTVRFWDAATGKALNREYRFPKVNIWDIDIDKDNRWLAIGRSDGVASIYNLDNDKALTDIQMNGLPDIYVVRFSPTEARLAIGASSGEVLFWTLTTKTPGPKHLGAVYAMDYSADGMRLVSGGADSTARISVPYQGGQRFMYFHGDWVEDVAFGPDASWFASASDDYKVRVWSTVTGDEKLRMEHANFVTKVRVSPDGEWIASASYDLTVRIWNSSAGNRVMEIPLSAKGTALAFSPDSNHLVVGDYTGHISIWDISDLQARIGFIEFKELARKAIFSQDGNWLAVITDDKKVRLFKPEQWLAEHDGKNGKVAFETDELGKNLIISPDGKWLLVAQPSDSSAQKDVAILYNLAEQKKVESPLTHGGNITDIQFSWDNSLAAISGSNGQIYLWKIDDPASVETILSSEKDVFSVAFHPTQNWLFAGKEDNIEVWDLNTKTKKDIQLSGPVQTLEVSPNGKWLMAGTPSTLQIFSLDGNSLPTAPTYGPYYERDVISARFSPDSHLLAIGGTAGYTYVYDMDSGKEISRIPHTSRITSVSFSNDGKMLVTASNKVVQIWSVANLPILTEADIRSVACKRLENAPTIDWQTLFPDIDSDYAQICPGLATGK